MIGFCPNEVKVSSAHKTRKQRGRGITPFHVKGKAELWYCLKDLLKNKNRERSTFLDNHIIDIMNKIVCFTM